MKHDEQSPSESILKPCWQENEAAAANRTPETEAQRRGRLAETMVANTLIAKGYQIIERNARFLPYGEIDLIAGRDQRLIFVEVKARRSQAYGGGAAAITSAKINRLQRTAQVWLKTKHKMNMEIYFLAAIVSLNRQGEPVKIAFEPIEWV